MSEIDGEPLDPLTDPAHQALLERYVDAFERYDMTALVQLLRDDVVLSMPPFDLWLQGPDEVVRWMVGPGAACEGSKLVPITLSGTAAFGSYKRSGERRWDPWSVQVIEVADGRIVGHHNYLHPEWFAELGLPTHLEG